MYIVLFKDGSMLPLANEPEAKHFQSGARFYQCKDDMTMLDLSEWYANGHNKINRRTKQGFRFCLIQELSDEHRKEK